MDAHMGPDSDYLSLNMSRVDRPQGRSSSDPKAVRTVFLDTEFTTLDFHRNPLLLSLGMVGDDGREFYAEMDLSLGRVFRSRSTQFVRDEVLTQFGKIPGRAMSTAKLTVEAAEWIEELGAEGPVRIVYDYSWDMDFLEIALAKAGGVSCRLDATHVGYLNGDDDGDTAAEQSIKQSTALQGLLEHHSLADARALKAAFDAVHGKYNKPAARP